MQVDLDSVAQLYSSKTDEELLAIASDSDSLEDGARALLLDELRRRKLNADSITPGAAMFAIGQLIDLFVNIANDVRTLTERPIAPPEAQTAALEI